MTGRDGATFERWIGDRAERCGIDLSPEVCAYLAFHAERVRAEADRLHLTAIRDPHQFLERHVGESLEGAALIPREAIGTALDLGSGNGYPGIPVAAVHPGLRMHLCEASAKKTAFLCRIAEQAPMDLIVVDRQVQRAADLPDIPELGVITSRAVGGWERILPRLSSKLAANGRLLLWAGLSGATVATRAAWSAYQLAGQRPLPGRDRSWVFVYSKKQ